MPPTALASELCYFSWEFSLRLSLHYRTRVNGSRRAPDAATRAESCISASALSVLSHGFDRARAMPSGGARPNLARPRMKIARPTPHPRRGTAGTLRSLRREWTALLA
jgi:hypothetical protein